MVDEEGYHAVIEHKASYPYSVEFRTGEKVTVSDKKENGWVWCINKEGIGVWVPESYLSLEDQTGTMLSDYSSTELTVEVGERLMFVKEESGWIWCMNQNGKSGWVPSHKVRRS